MRKDKKGRILRKGEYQDASGRYYYKYMDARGNRKAVYSWKLVATDRTPQGKKEDLSLREKEQILIRDLEDGIDISQAMQTNLNELIKAYLDTKTNIKEKTLNKYIQLWELHIKDSSLGHMLIPKIKKANIQKFYADLCRTCSDATIRMYHNNLIMPAFTFAVDNDLLRKNPAKGCLEGYNKSGSREALSIHEQEIFLNYVKESSRYEAYLPMFQVMIGTACRVGEICGLTDIDVDFKERMIKIDHQLNYEKVNGKMTYYISTPKTERGIRDIPMTELVYKSLIKQKKLDLMIGRRNDFEVDGYKNFVFLNGNGKPFTTSLINAILKRIVDSYNAREMELAKKEKRRPDFLPHITNHILRHTGCTRMAESGMDAKVLQTLMGHNDIQVTMKVYNHVDKKRLKKEIKKVECIIS